MKEKVWLLFLFTVPMTIALLLLQFTSIDKQPLQLMKGLQKDIPDESVYLQTHYQRSFTDDGTNRLQYVWLGQIGKETVREEITGADHVYLDAQAVVAPYLLYTGNTLHFTSVDRVGSSESQWVFSEYAAHLYQVADAKKRIFLYRIEKPQGNVEELDQRLNEAKQIAYGDTVILVGKANPGSPVIFSSTRIQDMVYRERVDYGDPFLWLWQLISGQRDPLGWTYADADGVFSYPIDKDIVEKHALRMQGEHTQDVWVTKNGEAARWTK